VRRARSYEGDFIFHRKHPEIYRQRHFQKGPLFWLVVYHGIKHFLRLTVSYLPYGMKHPGTYAKFLAACALERAYLFYLLPTFCRKYRLQTYRPEDLKT
jgi:hypothetical protein